MRRLLPKARGQSTAEYALVSITILGFTTVGWPFVVQLLNALDTYFQSVYYVIQSPLP